MLMPWSVICIQSMISGLHCAKLLSKVKGSGIYQLLTPVSPLALAPPDCEAPIAAAAAALLALATCNADTIPPGLSTSCITAALTILAAAAVLLLAKMIIYCCR